MHLFETRPMRLHVARTGSAGVTELAAEDQHRTAVDDQAYGGALGLQPWHLGASGAAEQQTRQGNQPTRASSHHVLPSRTAPQSDSAIIHAERSLRLGSRRKHTS